MGERDLLLAAIRVLERKRQILARSEALEADDINLVIRADLVVVSRVHERQREHALLLQVGLVNTCEGASDDGKTAKEAGLKRSVLAGGTFTVVVVTNDDPLDAAVTVVGTSLGNTAVFASNLVLDLVGLTVLNVDSTDQAVFCVRSCQKHRIS